MFVAGPANLFFFGKGQLCTHPGSLTAKAPEKLPSTQIGKASRLPVPPIFQGPTCWKKLRGPV